MFTSIRPEGYQDISVFSYSPNASIVVLSATDINSAKVLLKSALIDLNQDSSPLFNEFSNIQAVIQFHEKNRFTRPVSRRRSSSVNDAVRNLGNISEDAAKSYKGPASWSNLDTIIAPLSIDRSTGRNVYVYRDYGSTSLSEYILQLPDNKLSIESAIRIGFSISQALDLVHQAGFICQNICSKNVNIWWDDNVLHSQLASFEMASGVQQVATVYAIENNNLGYISPEQTGKVEREVDHRTDLYSLGILLWEILVGRLPFRDKGSKQVIYAHMARVPENPKNLNKLVPDVLSKIIMKLLRKDPVDRYQSASALTYDLSLCLDAIIKFRSKNEVPSELELSHEELALVFGKLSYELGSKDFYSTLQYTKRLYGKDYELDTLRNIYHETALGNLVGMVVMLKGTAYSGRKELLKTAAKHALAYGMITVMGNEYKEEGFEFKPIIKVLEEIFAIIISQTRQFIRDWEIRLNNLLSENGQYILSQLLPECRDYLKYTSSENWHAFTNVNDPQAFETVQLFIRSFVSKQDPLAIFLQSSSASSKIFDFLCYMSNCKIQYLLFIVKTDGFESIRENDTQKLPTISRSTIIECKPLSINHVKDIISDIMRPISDDVTELAKFLSQNSQGVSGVILETLRLCESQGLIGYNKSKNTWSWDMEEIKRKISVADTFASHLLLHMDSLSSDTKSVLKRAALIGMEFNSNILSAVSFRHVNDLAPILMSLVTIGYIKCVGSRDAALDSAETSMNSLHSSYSGGSLPQLTPYSSAPNSGSHKRTTAYMFSHEVIHKYASQLVDAESNNQIHYRIAGLLKNPENEIRALNHYNKALDIIQDHDDIVKVAFMNYCYSKRLYHAGDVVEAHSHALISGSVLNRIPTEILWLHVARLAYEVNFWQCQTFIAVGEFQSAKDHLDNFEPFVPDTKKIFLRGLRSRILLGAKAYDEALDIILSSLKNDGPMGVLKLHSSERASAAQNLLQVTQKFLDSGLKDEIEYSDIQAFYLSMFRQGVEILGKLERFEEQELLKIYAATFSMSLPYTSYALVDIAAILPVVFAESFSSRNYVLPRALSKILWENLKLNADHQESLACIISFLNTDIAYNDFVPFLTKFFSNQTRSVQNRIQFQESLQHVIYGLMVSNGRSLSSMTDLIAESENHLNQIDAKGDESFKRQILEEIQALKNGSTQFVEYKNPQISRYAKYLRMVVSMLHKDSHKSHIVGYLERNIQDYAGTWCFLDILFFSGICISDNELSNDKKILLLNDKIDAMETYCASMGQGSTHHFKVLAVIAEKEIFMGDPWRALESFEKAIFEANTQENIMFAAFISDRFCKLLSMKKFTYFNEALSNNTSLLWKSFGTEELINGSNHASFDLKSGALQTRSSVRKDSSNSSMINADAVLNISKSIATISSIEKLVESILDHLTSATCATYSIFCLIKDNEMLIFTPTKEFRPISNHESGVPLQVFNYVKKTGEIISSQKTEAEELYLDGYLVSKSPKSFLCVPMYCHNSIIGIAYFENNLVSDAFTSAEIELIRSILTSAAISIENLRLISQNSELSEALKSKSIQNQLAPKLKLDTPIQQAFNAVRELKKNFPPNDPVIEKLDFLVSTLASDGLFNTDIESIDESMGKTMDTDTKSFIQNSLLQKPTLNNSRKKGSRKSIFQRPRSKTIEGKIFEEESFPMVNAEDRLGLNSLTELYNYLQESLSLNFNIFKLQALSSGSPLSYLTNYVIRKHQFVQYLKLNESYVQKFFKSIEAAYLDQPYHNSTHAADVLQFVCSIFLETKESQSFTKLELFSLVIACAIHDVDHPGVSNSFLVASRHDIATLYNDISVLESHHICRAFEISKQPDCDVFAGLSNEQYKSLREMIISNVLATDLTNHFPTLLKFKGKLSANSLSFQDDMDRQLIMKMVIKCGDLGNPTREFSLSKKWTGLVMEEFFRQGDMERKQGLPVSKFMDRNDTNVPKCQIGFIDYLVSPLFEAWAEFSSGSHSTYCLQNIAKNRETWASLQDTKVQFEKIECSPTPLNIIYSPIQFATKPKKPSKLCVNNLDKLKMIGDYPPTPSSPLKTSAVGSPNGSPNAPRPRTSSSVA